MKFASKLIIFTLLAFAASVYAQPLREELKQMVEQLQKTPTDNVLREKIIKLVPTLKSSPVLPPEAERRMARGAAAFKGAVSVADYQDAAKEFEQATLAAPWYGDAYFNLGVAQDKAENYETALRSLNLALLASPDSKDIKALIYEVEYRQEKARPEARAAKQKLVDEALTRSLEGAVFTLRSTNIEWQYRILNGRADVWTRRTASRGPMCGDGFRRDGPIGEEVMCPDGTGGSPQTIPLDGRHGEVHDQLRTLTIEIAEDGQSLLKREKWSIRTNESPEDEVYKRR